MKCLAQEYNTTQVEEHDDPHLNYMTFYRAPSQMLQNAVLSHLECFKALYLNFRLHYIVCISVSGHSRGMRVFSTLLGLFCSF